MQSPVAVAVLRKISEKIGKVRRSEDGQDLLEYGLLAGLIAIVALSAVTTVGNTIHSVFWQVIGQNF
jgi:Flp pilus assembly pilin Flp